MIDWVLHEGNFTGRPHDPATDDVEWIWLNVTYHQARTDNGKNWKQVGRRFGVEADRFFLNLLVSLECDWVVGNPDSNQVGSRFALAFSLLS